MPSSICHLRIAYNLATRIDVQNLSDFYLGSVSPDAVNVNGFVSKNIRYPAHLRVADYDKWKSACRNFYLENESAYLDCLDFLKGYAVHIFTDVYWDELVQPDIFQRLSEMDFDERQFRDEKRNELARYNNYLCGEWLDERVMPLLAKAECHKISTVDKQMLSKYRDYLCNEYTETMSDEHPKICNNVMINLVEEAVLREMNFLCS